MTNDKPSQQDSLGAINRRQFVGASLAAAAAVGATGRVAAAAESAAGPKICSFIKFVQALSYEDMAAAIAEIGFDGTESTVRRKGHVDPQRVEEDLPRHVEAVRNAGLEVTMMTTDVLGVDSLSERVLRTGAALGIKQYRMGFYRYDTKRGVMEQLDEIRPRVQELAALNRELGISAVYQNHCGANFVGAPLWDLRYLLTDIPKEEIGSAFDIRHASVEGGTAWPLHYDIMKPHIGAVYVKDFQWDGAKPKHVPLGTGRVDKEFFKLHQASGIDCPVSLHVEYLQKSGVQENLDAMRRDLAVLREWLSA